VHNTGQCSLLLVSAHPVRQERLCPQLHSYVQIEWTESDFLFTTNMVYSQTCSARKPQRAESTIRAEAFPKVRLALRMCIAAFTVLHAHY